MTDYTWTKKTLADILGDDRGLPDWAADMVAKFGPEDLDELRRDEREAALSAFGRIARQSRDARGREAGEDRPAWVEGDIDWGLRAARAALEAVPAGKRSEKATDLLADCECPSAVGPHPGRDASTPGTENW
ncbi:hypothetical protein OCGS_1112 [Oceaniovalibus guishaninsula JLT2003]|uniref:Uncharacterized protein n=1 Tax=Oceaniovalibus guishaninsula JLT2003 TaxID=1231392 RepID=K2HPD9_9RHOB|nr:hypothetical protein [Oceaniovalibus guishaninsula]EKE44729.1 hypothetical protein OCGS_1112 [Oceaniovalibus guishaninsula JLT2003]